MIEIHPSYALLHYIFIFPRGEDGDEDNTNNKLKKCITTMNYFAYQLQVDYSEEAITLHYYERLFQ
ncbi:hypothetical protein C1645_826288 [Glomus cerebriforme]|uniref:Uncharacterized protein n=1 Tax=Glomus cerebriforme TaxID=658196 RepID=A0A397SR74_9GLOM|nr:hypothetical protein C1645_826288 [Glomus cerebriforme]